MGRFISRARSAGLRTLYRSRLPYVAYDLLQMVSLPVSSRYPLGTNIFERDWDALLVLDTCRADAMREVAPEFDFVEEVESIWSVGSATAEWVANTFTEAHREAIGRTAYVASHGSVHWVLSESDPAICNAAATNVLPKQHVRRFTDWKTVGEEDFLFFDPVYRYELDSRTGLTDPARVTDRAIAVAREHDPDRLIVHYKPPHAPYVARALREDRDLASHEEDPWGALRSGTPRETVWEAYLDELRLGLESIEPLLSNLDADRVVITADHGEAFGEMGLYSHPIGVPHPVLRRVPWVETTATDTGERDPDVNFERETDETVRDQLEKLGYL